MLASQMTRNATTLLQQPVSCDSPTSDAATAQGFQLVTSATALTTSQPREVESLQTAGEWKPEQRNENRSPLYEAHHLVEQCN